VAQGLRGDRLRPVCGAPRSVAIHDKVYSDLANGMADQHLRTFLEPRGQEWVRLADGQDL
jgi:hypothetical protein